MTVKYLLSGALGALALGFMAMSAQAAPLGGVTADLKTAAGPTSSAQDVYWRRRCWRGYHGRLQAPRARTQLVGTGSVRGSASSASPPRGRSRRSNGRGRRPDSTSR